MGEVKKTAANDAETGAVRDESAGIFRIKQLARWLAARASRASCDIHLHTLVRILQGARKEK